MKDIHIKQLHGLATAKLALNRSFGSTTISPEMLERNRALYGQPLTPEEVVQKILSEVRNHGDAAVLHYAKLLDGLPEFGIEVPTEKLIEAQASIPKNRLSAIRHAVQRLRDFHEQQPTTGFINRNHQGMFGQLLRPIERLGIYAPNGAAPLASSVIHTAVPAVVAGVKEIVLCTPPNRNGELDATTLAAALECGVSRVFALGGATAIAAMAYGTNTVAKVDKIGGPGNIYTVLAMRAVYGQVGIVSLPGPTETMVIADHTAKPSFVAADLLAQAEHAQAQPVLVATNQKIFNEVLSEIASQLATLPEPNRSWSEDSFLRRGAMVLVENLDEAFELANHYAPEHLCLLIENPESWLNKVQHAGGVFVGEDSMEALGDYLAGPSHVMPTGGTARFSSPVNVRDFQKIISLVGLNRTTLEKCAPDAALLARAEGLEAHARAIEARLKTDS